MRHGPFPQMTPSILDNMEIIVLDLDGLAPYGSNRLVVGRTAINIEGLQLQSQLRQALQKRLDRFLIFLIHRLRRDNPSMLIAHHQDAGIDPFGKPFVEVRFVNRLLGVETTDDLIAIRQLRRHFVERCSADLDTTT